MAKSIELTAEQLSALDQIISQKQKGEAIFTDITDNLVGCQITLMVCFVPAVVAVTQVVAGMAISGEDLGNSSLSDVVKNIPV